MRKSEKARREARRQEAIATLKEQYGVQPGTIIHTVLVGISRTALKRQYVLLVVHDGVACDITYLAARILQARRGKMGGMWWEGAWESVYCMSRYMFPDGFTTANGEHNDNGGYALRHMR